MTEAATFNALPELEVFGEPFARDPAAAAAAAGVSHGPARSSRGIEVCGYREGRAALLDARLAIGFEEMYAASGMPSGPVFDRAVSSIGNLEGAEHRRVRTTLARWFAPARIEALRDDARSIIEPLVRALPADGGDAVVMADRIPSTMFCRMIGAPDADAPFIARISDAMLLAFSHDPANAPLITAAFEEMDDYLGALIAERRHRPGDDVVSHVLEAVTDGELDEAAVVPNLTALLRASSGSTAAQLATVVDALATHMDWWDAAVAAGDELGGIALELARLAPASWSIERRAREDLVLLDVEIPRGTAVFVLVPIANRDASAYPAPDRLDPAREAAPSPLQWGAGRHFCLGRTLAVMEIEELVRALLRTYANITIDGPVPEHGKPTSRRLERVPVRVTPHL